MPHYSTEFLSAVETGTYYRPRTRRARLIDKAIGASQLIESRLDNPTADLASPALLRHALECANKAVKLLFAPGVRDLQEVEDLLAIAEAHKRWAYERLTLGLAGGGDELFRAYWRGLCTADEFCQLANREAHVECSCHPVIGGMCRTCRAEVEE